MKKINLVVGSVVLSILLLISIVSALNIEFTIGVEDRIFFPNETIPINISVINRETKFSAKSVNLTLNIGKRSYKYELGEIKAGESVLENLTLPEFPPGDYIIHGILNYTGYFGEVSTLETYNSFHVRFPEIQRLPRNIVIKNFILSENLISGKTYPVNVEISNEGDVAGDLIIELVSLDVKKSKNIHLEPGETDTTKIEITFLNSGISVIEARVYAIVDNIKYLLSFDVKNVFVKEERLAKIVFDRVELIDESDNKINQNDRVKIKIYIKNLGNSMATNVKTTLKSRTENIEILKPEANFSIILADKRPVGEIFEISTKNAQVETVNLSMDISYDDFGGTHITDLQIPIEIHEGSNECDTDNDCLENEICVNKQCEKIPCECGEIVNRKCIKYSCCNDLDC
jgi:hypothetical protein